MAKIISAVEDSSVSRDEILSLTGLRFVAAFIVFIFHINLHWPISKNIYINNILSQGAIGMSIFFMLSGFILTYTYAGKRFTPIQFYRNRFARIYPIYVSAALATAPILYFVAQEGLIGFVKIALTLIADILMIQAWFPQLFFMWNNNASWSLSAEAFFYALFPFFLPGLLRLDRSALWLTLVMAYGISVAIGMVYAVFEPRPTFPLQIFYAMPIFRLPEFVIGMCIFLLTKERQPKWLDGAAIGMVTVLVVYLAAVGGALPLYILHSWIVIPTVALVLVASMSRGGLVSGVLGTSWLVWFGKISYCFYSFYLVVFYIFWAFRESLPANSLIVLLMAFVLLLAISAAGYHFVEEPVRQRLQAKRRSSIGVELLTERA